MKDESEYVVNYMDLMCKYGDTVKQLRSNGIVRTKNIVGEFAEYLVCKKMGFDLADKSQKSYDAICPRTQEKYQIKSRWSAFGTRANYTEFGMIKNYFPETDNKTFDYLIVIIFKDNFEILEAYKIPYDKVKNYAVSTKSPGDFKVKIYNAKDDCVDISSKLE